jgi:hypothetical protein
MNINIKPVLLISLLICCILLFPSCGKKRTPVLYELPKGFSGWVTIKFEKKNAPPFENIGGKYHVKISNEGFAETSSVIEDGWAEDEYYWMDGDKKVILPQYTEEKKSKIHAETYSNAGFQNFVNLDTLEIGKEITLFDGSKVTKLDDKGGVSFKSGRYLLFTFYVSEKIEDIWDFANKHLPPIPKEHETW